MNSYIFYGSKEEFETKIPNNYNTLTEMAMKLDVNKMIVHIEGQTPEEDTDERIFVENFVVSSQEYASVTEHVILNFANFIAKMDIKNIFLHNPPLQISNQIERLYPKTIIERQEYKSITEDIIKKIALNYDEKVIGQKNVKNQILKAIMPLTFSDRIKPVVMLFYGKSGIGKTETANFIAECLDEKIFRKQFSMFQNNQFSTYLFGGTHSEKGFAKDLLDRQSNVILLDEFDKANSVFHSAFYQLFDEGIFEDQNYYVKLEKSIIICTSNYTSITEIKDALGDAIYNRFDVIIGFDNLSPTAKTYIGDLCIKDTKERYKKSKDIELPENILNILRENISNCENARAIHHLIEDTFSLYYIHHFINDN